MDKPVTAFGGLVNYVYCSSVSVCLARSENYSWYGTSATDVRDPPGFFLKFKVRDGSGLTFAIESSIPLESRLPVPYHDDMSSELPKTRWSLVAKACADDTEARRDALNVLLLQYRPVLVRQLIAFLDCSEPDAEDLVQTFVVERLLVVDSLLLRADQARGRLRNFLMKSFKNFVLGEQRKERALKRTPLGPQAVRLDENPDILSYDEDFAASFDRAWAGDVLERTIGAVRAECVTKGLHVVWGVFSRRILEPALTGVTAPSYQDLVAEFAIESPTQAMNALVTAKRVFRRCLTEVVRDTMADDSCIDEEINDLMRCFQGTAAGSFQNVRST